jgi:hypothetical protein
MKRASATAVILCGVLSLNGETIPPPGEIQVSGSVSGVWAPTSVMVVTGDLVIPDGTTLIIMPGTAVKFNGSYSLTVEGVLIADGMPESQILFTSNRTAPTCSDWYGIQISNNGTILRNCIIEYCVYPVSASYCSPLISNNRIRRFSSSAVGLMFSNSIVRENEIYDFDCNDFSGGISAYQGTPTIVCNSIHDGNGHGIGSQGPGVIAVNQVYNLKGTAITCGYWSYTLVENNVIHDCGTGILLGETVGTPVTATLVNNTIYRNGYGISMSRFFATPIIVNNIVVSNTVGIFENNCSFCQNTPVETTYNDVWNNPGGNYVGIPNNSLGVMTGTNANGDPVDQNNNLCIDPLFHDGGPGLSSNSPCRNAGKSTVYPHIGADVTRMCATMVLEIRSFGEGQGLMIYPNPATEYLQVVDGQGKGIRSMQLIDIAGRSIHKQNGTIIPGTAEFDLKTVDPGHYCLRIVTNDGMSRTYHIVKTER